MADRLIIAPQWVREAWEDIQTWSDARTQREAQRLQRQQPFVLVYLLATLEDEGAEALTLGFELAHAVGGAYRRALGVQPTPIGEHVMEQAAEETMTHFADLAEAEPELAYRRMMFGRELAVPAVLTECLKILFEVSADVPEIEAALGALFISIMAIAKAYERVHGMAAADSAKSSLAESIEQETGQPIPKLGRNEPCPCGSGKKFKKCCGQRTALPPAPLRLSHAEEELQRYLDIVDRVWTYVEESKRDPDVRWLTTALDRFAARYHPGEPNGVPDSLYLSGGLFDFAIPRRERTLGELFLERRGARLTEAGRRSLGELCASYVAFYEVLEPRPAEHTKRLRELVSGDEWLANDVEESDVELSEPGMIWLCRLVGPRDDAVTFMSPLVYPVAAHAGIEGFVRALLAGQPAMGLPAVMKRSVEALADYIIATMPVEADDEADADDDILCDEDWDDDE